MRPEPGIRKCVHGVGLCRSSLGFLLQLNVCPKKCKKIIKTAPPSPSLKQKREYSISLLELDLTSGKSYI